MMQRENLEKYKDKSIVVLGKIVEVSARKRSMTKNYLLLKDIQDLDGNYLSNHAWIQYKNIVGNLGIDRQVLVQGTAEKYGPGDFGIKSYRVEVVK